MKVLRFLEGADDGIVGSFQNADHASRSFLFGPESFPFPIEADDDLVAVHGGAGVFFRDVDVAVFRRRFWNEKGESFFVEGDSADNQIGLLGQHEAIFSDADDFALVEHVFQHAAVLASLHGVQAQFRAEFGPAERVIIWRSQKPLDFGANVH